MTRKQINDQFEQYTPLLHKLSHQCANRCGRPEEEIYGEACYLFMIAIEAYDPARGAFGRYLWSVVHNGLYTWAFKYDLPPDTDNLPEESTRQTPRDNAMFHDWLAGLSDECREVAMIILNGPAEVLDIPLTAGKKMVMGALRRYLREEKHWSWPRIWGAFKEIKQEVAAL